MVHDCRNADGFVDMINPLASFVAVKARVMNADYRSRKVEDRPAGRSGFGVAIMRKVGKLMILEIHPSRPSMIVWTLDAAFFADQLERAVGVVNQEDFLALLGNGLADA
jgi:hypothetical protein